jgi:hypothetical protein
MKTKKEKVADKKEKKSKITLFWESMEEKKPLFEYIDMRAVLK